MIDASDQTPAPLVTLSAKGRELLSKVFSLPKADSVSGTTGKDVGAPGDAHDNMTQKVMSFLNKGTESASAPAGAKPKTLDQEGDPELDQDLSAGTPAQVPARNKLNTSVATVTQTGLRSRLKRPGSVPSEEVP